MMKNQDDKVFSRKEIAIDLTVKIESMLEGFGIQGRIVAVTFENNHICLELNIAPGVRIEEVESLGRTMAMVVASPTGRVNIVAPMPGTSVIGIKVPNSKRDNSMWVVVRFFQNLLTVLMGRLNSPKNYKVRNHGDRRRG